jgi:anion transporter
MAHAFTAQQLTFFVILAAAVVLLLTERLRNDLVALLVIVALAATGVLPPGAALSGFSSEPAITVAAVFVLGAGLHSTGLSLAIGAGIGRLAGQGYVRMLAVIMLAVGLFAAFTHHVTAIAVMLPVTLALARRRAIAPSRLLMPLAIAASLGTTITVIGAPAFVVADGILRQAGRPGLAIFSIAPIGLTLSVTGALFMLLVGRFLLPARAGAVDGPPEPLPEAGAPQRRGRAALAGAIMAATVLAAALNLLSIELAALAGAAAMVLTGCLSLGQAYRAIDARIFVFIAGAMPLGAAMHATGTADLIAGWLQRAVAGWPVFGVLLALFAIVGLVTQVMSDAATTALFSPVAIALAAHLGLPPEPFVVTVAMAAVVAFLTPIGHHGNLLVYGPGGYRFADFARVGAPLTVLCACVVAWLAPLLWRA